MATAAQLPGQLGLAFRRGDEYGTLIDFSVSTTGWTWSSQIVSAVTGATVATPAVTVVNASAGQVNVSVNETQSAALVAGTYWWRLVAVQPGGVTRTMLDSACEVFA